uniref:Quaking_NLS domain-containing protein n=1 Tax=Loa loa TaxID=7209 RepID=A0A1I7VJJ8_LOALO
MKYSHHLGRDVPIRRRKHTPIIMPRASYRLMTSRIVIIVRLRDGMKRFRPRHTHSSRQ